MGLNIAENVCAPILSGSPSAFPGSFGILGADWIGLTFLALLCSLFALVIVYVLSSIFKQNAAAVWAKFELFQLFATAILVLMTTSFIIFGMCSFDMRILDPQRYADPNNPDQMRNLLDIVEDYFRHIEATGNLLFGILVYLVNWLTGLARLGLRSSPIGVGWNENPLESLMQLNNMFFILISGFVISYLMVVVQLRIIEFMSIASLYYLFPFGIFFRAFEPTRAFGGTLIGIAITFFLFFPVLIVFNDYMVYGAMDEANAQMVGAIASGDAQMQQGNASPSGIFIADGAQDGSLERGLSSSVSFVFRPLMLYMIAAVVLPVINFTILVEIARGLTKLLGEEVDVTNLTRLI